MEMDSKISNLDYKDKFTLRYCISWLLLITPLGIIAFFPFAGGAEFFITIITALCALVVLAYNIILVLYGLYRKNWRRVLSAIFAPILIIIFLTPLQILHIPMRLYLLIHKADYLIQISQLPDDGKPKTKWFNIGGWGGAGASEGEYSIVYDESDAVAKPDGVSKCTALVHLEGHFYYANTVESGCIYGDNP